MKQLTLAAVAALALFAGAAAAEDFGPSRDTLAQIAPGKTTYAELVRLMGPPNEDAAAPDGSRLVVYSGHRDASSQRVGFLFFGWRREVPAANYRIELQLRDGVVQTMLSK